MSLPRSGIYKNGVQQEVDPTSLPDADTSAKGAVKQGVEFTLCPIQNWAFTGGSYDNTYVTNTANKNSLSLKKAGVFSNSKLRVVVDWNDEYYSLGNCNFGGYEYPNWLVGEYNSGDTFTINFSIPSNIPASGNGTFLGYALTPNATGAGIDYPYDESDPQSYTLNFTNSDIILYAIWGEPPKYTVTYHRGAYGTGNVPDAEQVTEGEDYAVVFSPTPQVNDGSGRLFVGWVNNPNYDEQNPTNYNNYNQAQYTYEGHESIYEVYENIDLYPVFCSQYSITYSHGNDASGDDPDTSYLYNGKTADLDYYPDLTYIGSESNYVFIGWKDQNDTMYYKDNNDNIVVTGNVMLTAVFGEEQGGSSTVCIGIGNNSSSTITIYYVDSEKEIPIVSDGEGGYCFYAETGLDIRINTSGNVDAQFYGTYQGDSGYEGTSLDTSTDPTEIYAPDTTYNVYWNFWKGDHGSIDINEQE